MATLVLPSDTGSSKGLGSESPSVTLIPLLWQCESLQKPVSAVSAVTPVGTHGTSPL